MDLEICPRCGQKGSGAYEEARLYQSKKKGWRLYWYVRFVHPFRRGNRVTSKTCRLSRQRLEMSNLELKTQVWPRWKEKFYVSIPWTGKYQKRRLYRRGKCPHCGKQARFVFFRRQFHCSKCKGLVSLTLSSLTMG